MVNEIEKQIKHCKSNCNIWIDENRYRFEVSKCICFKSKFIEQCQYCIEKLEYGAVVKDDKVTNGFDDFKNLGIYKKQ